jgi:23S rRNA-/tRNA-specific pseudouridylate synthase
MKDAPKIIFQDSELCIVSKPARVHFDEILPKDSPWQPIHRLDYETSGCIAFSSPTSFEAYRKLFSNSKQDPHTLRKTYLAGASKKSRTFKSNSFVEGWILSRYRSSKKVQFKGLDEEIERLSHRTKQEAEHRIEGPLAEDDPRCEVARRKLNFKGLVYQIDLITGARHQIRAFFASLNAPLIGDPLYGPDEKPADRLELHSWKLEMKSPVSGREYKFVDEGI